MTRARRSTILGRIVPLILVALALTPGTAAACAIDNKASLFVGGVQATLNSAAPTATGAALWARFTIDKAFASAAPLQFDEMRSELAATLPAAMIAAPYRWVFGDGSVALGHVVTHRYARPGMYRLMVYGYSTATRSWFPFDSALLRIVPPGQVLQSNLGYYALRALDVVMSGIMWLIDAALIALVLYAIVRRRRRATPQMAEDVPAGPASGDPAPGEPALDGPARTEPSRDRVARYGQGHGGGG